MSEVAAETRRWPLLMSPCALYCRSTTLAKVAYYLKSHGHSPLIAACDTFRSGAVEQLRVHSDCLGVPLFQR